MATKPNEVTEIRFYNVHDVMRITGMGKTYCQNLIKRMNEKLANEGKFTIAGKINANTFNSMF